MRALTPADVDLHTRLRIEADLLESFGVRRVNDHEARELLAVNGRPGKLDGIIYPYLDPVTRHATTYRLRRDHPEMEDGKPRNKYLSAAGDRRHLYFVLDDAGVLKDRTVTVLEMEAEKSTLAAAAAARRMGRSILPVGLGGCWSWRGRIGKTVDANGARVDESGPLPDLARIEWTNRDVVLAFDSNAATNASVQAARRALAFELTQRGACVRILALPVEDGINGPDDFIGRHGDAAFFELLDRASDARTFDAIFRLNLKHAVVPEGGKTFVVSDEYDPALKRHVLQRSTFADFRNLYLNEVIQVGTDKKTGAPIWKSLGSVWLAHADRRQYHGFVMRPAGDEPGYLNLWRGFAVTPKAGAWPLFHDHIRGVICSGDESIFSYVMAWLAFGVQHPERQAEVALALRGLRGTGKGLFARIYGELFGQHYLQIANTKHLTGNFNAHLQDTIVLFADEAFWAGDKAGESVLKMLVTEPVIPIERKGRDLVRAPNLLHLIIASNNEWVVPAGMDERRFCVLDVNPEHQQHHAYFAAIVAEMDAGGRAALLHDLLAYDLEGFNLRAVPQTEALRQQKVLSLSPNERWLFDKLMAGQWLQEHQGWETFVLKNALHDDYITRLQRVGIDRRSTETELGMFMSKMLPGVYPQRRTLDGRRRWGWTMPDLKNCRSAFDAATNSNHPWPEVE